MQRRPTMQFFGRTFFRSRITQWQGPQRKIKRPGGQGSREGRKNTAERKGFAEFPYPQWAPVWFWDFLFFSSKPLRLRNDAHGAPLAVLLQLKIRNPNQTIASTSPSAPVAMQSPCQSRRSGFGSWHQWAMKTAITALAVTRAQSKGQ